MASAGIASTPAYKLCLQHDLHLDGYCLFAVQGPGLRCLHPSIISSQVFAAIGFPKHKEQQVPMLGP